MIRKILVLITMRMQWKVIVHHEKNLCMLVNNSFMASTREVIFLFFLFSFNNKNKQTNSNLRVSQKRDHIMTTNLWQGKVLLGYPNYHLNKINGNMNDRSKIIQGSRETVFFFQATNTGGHPSSLQCQICNN